MFAIKPLTLAAMLGSTVLFAGCMAAPTMTEQETELKDSLDSSSYMPASRTMRDNIETQELFAQAAFWSREYDLNPSDLEATIKLASSVRKLGNPERAVEITQMGRALYPRDPYLGAEYGAALISAERAAEASPVLDEMLRIAPGYARLWSLKGAALDQMENYDLARKHYARALQITPHDPNILTNIGLSHALAGDAAAAEGWLRRAAAMPGAGPAVQQNLALVLKLQGKSEEAGQYDKRASAASQTRPAFSPKPQMSPSYSAPAATRPVLRPASPASSQPSFSNTPRATMHTNGQYKSSSDAARHAAQRAAQRNQQQVTSAEQLRAQQEVLASLRNGNPPTQATPQFSKQSYPQSGGYPQTQPPAYNNSTARRRR